jgi:hypothetical protein
MSHKGKDRLRQRIQQEFKSINKQVLDLSELVVSDKHYSQFRKKILNITNDIRRNIEQDIELNYEVTYDPATECEDIVVIGTGKSYKIDYKRKGKNDKGTK